MPRTAESGVWKSSHKPFTGTITAKICRDKEVGKVRRCFDVSIDIGEVSVLSIEVSKEEETSRRGTMGMTPHPTATNNLVDVYHNDMLEKSYASRAYKTNLSIGHRETHKSSNFTLISQWCCRILVT